ncbi:MAG: sugar phosphate nucleotidyltransferase [Chloroflexota bacterium]
MKIIIPLAGLGKRMRPHTHTRAKPMVRLAGKPILGHLLEWLGNADVEEFILVISPHQTDVEAYAQSATRVPVRIVVQDSPRGQADAIARAKGAVTGPVLVVFSDTLADTSLSELRTTRADGLIYVKEIPDPTRMGVVVVQDGRITNIIEKPVTSENRLAVIGMYYFADSARLFDAVDRVLSVPPTLNNEYFIADAIKLLIQDGLRIEPSIVPVWEDTGTPDYTLHAHRYLLDRLGTPPQSRPGVTIIPPVFVADDAIVEASSIGPYVTIESGCRVVRSVLSDAILDQECQVEDSVLTRSLLGQRVAIRECTGAFNLGDDSSAGPPGTEPLPVL